MKKKSRYVVTYSCKTERGAGETYRYMRCIKGSLASEWSDFVETVEGDGYFSFMVIDNVLEINDNLEWEIWKSKR